MENRYLQKGIKEECTGCGICQYICPVNAIEMVIDNEGFKYPEINNNKCIKCDKCKKYCSNFNNSKAKSKTYRGINKNYNELMQSSSGGMFTPFANQIIEEEGAVFGVQYDEELNVIHGYTQKIEEIKKFCGSKYVRSALRESYKIAKQFLENEKKVLFTGTSCQIQGLNVYLGKEYKNLLTIDIICHANPSPKIFKMYKQELEKTRKKKIRMIYFRSKQTGWRDQTPIIEYEDGKQEMEKTYFTAFLKELINRPCCYECNFARKERVSDITIGDFWGVEKIEPHKDNNKGISIFLINTEKGQEYLKKVGEKIDYKNIKFEEIVKYNHFENIKANKNRKIFFKQMEKTDSIIKLMNKYIKPSLLSKIKRKIKNIIKK